MGVNRGFWEQLRPVARKESLRTLRNKRLAVDLSYWLVQEQTAVKGKLRKPHLRLTFYRVVHLVGRLGAFPIFIVDGDPPELKQRIRLKRFMAMSGFPSTADSEQSPFSNVSRYGAFKNCVEESVELLKLLGMPVLRATGEAEALCAELNREGLVDACVTPDSDAFVHGAKCVIKFLQTNQRDPLVEVYTSEDIERILGLRRKHLVALALLVGCDYDLEGVRGVGCSNAIRLIRAFPEAIILDRLHAWGQGEIPSRAEMNACFSGGSEKDKDQNDPGVWLQDSNLETLPRSTPHKSSHCSNCGHPGNVREHGKSGCKVCGTSREDNSTESCTLGCKKKDKKSKCVCQGCLKIAQEKKITRQTDWITNLCSKLAATAGFPDKRIIDIFLSGCNFEEVKIFATSTKWKSPNMEKLESFLSQHLYWSKAYVRKKTLPLLSFLCLTELAGTNCVLVETHTQGLINGQFFPHSIVGIKIEHAIPVYMLKWEMVNKQNGGQDWLGLKFETSEGRDTSTIANSYNPEEDYEVANEASILIERPDMNFCSSFTTNENMPLIKAACPNLVDMFEEEQDAKHQAKSKRGKRKRQGQEAQAGAREQQTITSFFKSKAKSVRAVSLSAGKDIQDSPISRTFMCLVEAADGNTFDSEQTENAKECNISHHLNTGEELSSPIGVSMARKEEIKGLEVIEIFSKSNHIPHCPIFGSNKAAHLASVTVNRHIIRANEHRGQILLTKDHQGLTLEEISHRESEIAHDLKMAISPVKPPPTPLKRESQKSTPRQLFL